MGTLATNVNSGTRSTNVFAGYVTEAFKTGKKNNYKKRIDDNVYYQRVLLLFQLYLHPL